MRADFNAQLLQYGARGQTRTGTAYSPTDFKSVVSTYSTTRAIGLLYRIRTCDLLLRRQLLYPAELRADGGRRRTRTCNHSVMSGGL